MLERDMEKSYLTLEEDDDPMGQIQGAFNYLSNCSGSATGTKGLYLANPATE